MNGFTNAQEMNSRWQSGKGGATSNSKMGSSLYLVLGMFLLQFGFSVASGTIKGPPTAEKKSLTKRVELGEDVRLICPLTGNPTPIIDWYKGDEAINSYSWERFRANKKSLKIKGVIEEDNGVYICKGTNGFGSEEIRIHLMVIDPREFPDMDASPPVFSEATVSLPTAINMEAGDDLALNCEASGNPAVDVKWLKINRDPGTKSEILATGTGRAKLYIHALLDADAGSYSCVASNRFGLITRNFSLDVKGLSLRSEPVIVSGPANTTVGEGESAVMDCRARSSSHVNIQWLKRLDGAQIAVGGAIDRDIIDVGEEGKFRVIATQGDSVEVGEDEFVKKLVVDAASVADEGMYICFVTNFKGYKFRGAYLSVIPGTGVAGLQESPFMILVICLAIVVMLLILCIAFCVVKKRSAAPQRPFAESPDVQEDLMKANPQAAQQANQVQQAALQFPHTHRQNVPNQTQQQQQYNSQYQANLANAASNDRNMNVYVNKLDQPLPPPPPPPSLHNESSGNSNGNWGQQAMYQPHTQGHLGTHPNMMNFTDSSSSTKYNGAASLYGGQGSSVSQNQYEVPHVNVGHVRGSNQGLSSMGSGRYPGYQPQGMHHQQPIYPYRSQQYGYCED